MNTIRFLNFDTATTNTGSKESEAVLLDRSLQRFDQLNHHNLIQQIDQNQTTKDQQKLAQNPYTVDVS